MKYLIVLVLAMSTAYALEKHVFRPGDCLSDDNGLTKYVIIEEQRDSFIIRRFYDQFRITVPKKSKKYKKISCY